jgi:hypothetical protein
MTLRRSSPSRLLSLGLLALVWGAARPSAADAQMRRAGHWQFSVPINFVSGETIDGAGGSSAEMNNDVGWGIGFAYHINDRFMVGFETTWLGASYDATVPVDDDGDQSPDGEVTLGGSLDASSFQVLGQFHVLESGRWTPFLRGNLGFTYADSNIPSGPAEGTCWWDPWWGYVCSAWQPTYDRTSFSFGGAAGIRGAIGNRFFLEGSVNGLWVDFENDTPFLKGVRLTAGWLF